MPGWLRAAEGLQQGCSRVAYGARAMLAGWPWIGAKDPPPGWPMALWMAMWAVRYTIASLIVLLAVAWTVAVLLGHVHIS